MWDFTKLHCYSFVSYKIKGFIDLTESSFTNKSHNLVTFVQNRPFLLSKVAIYLLEI